MRDKSLVISCKKLCSSLRFWHMKSLFSYFCTRFTNEKRMQFNFSILKFWCKKNMKINFSYVNISVTNLIFLHGCKKKLEIYITFFYIMQRENSSSKNQKQIRAINVFGYISQNNFTWKKVDFSPFPPKKQPNSEFLLGIFTSFSRSIIVFFYCNLS